MEVRTKWEKFLQKNEGVSWESLPKLSNEQTSLAKAIYCRERSLRTVQVSKNAKILQCQGFFE